jgi:hypothetical protein
MNMLVSTAIAGTAVPAAAANTADPIFAAIEAHKAAAAAAEAVAERKSKPLQIRRGMSNRMPLTNC